MPRLYRKRCKRYDVPGHAHYLTFSCYQRRPLLLEEPPRRWLMESLVAARSKIAFDLWAYVIMPEHVHLLVWPREGTPVSEILRLVKLPVAKKALLWAHRENPAFLAMMAAPVDNGETAYHFWQRGGGYDRNLWSPADIREKIDYIHANAVRRGLAEHPQDWPWSGWNAWHGDGAAPVPIDMNSVPPLDT
ncbi:MAG: transposase [Planctomycetota bacterium]|nr:transposase [Planctomycetota bacterium]